MALFLVTFCVMLLIVAGMAIGVMFGRKPLAGSCGGLNAVGLDGECKICGRSTGSCESPEGSTKPQLGKPAA